jgi:hypothetical protein
MAKVTLSQLQRDLWQKLNAYVFEEGGWITSRPDSSPIRVECPIDSVLPQLLRDAGYEVASIGTAERLMPTGQHVAPGVVEVWQLELPPADSDKPSD